MKKLVALVLALALLCGFAACGQKPTLANAPLSLGEKYLLDLDYDQALAQLEEAIKIDPKNPRIQLLILYIYVHEDYPPEEIEERLPSDYDFTPPVVTPDDPEPRVPWLLAIIEALRTLNIRDLTLELLRRLADEFPLDSRVSATLNALADELGVALATSAATTTTTTTIVATTAATTVTTSAATTTTVKPTTATTKAITTTTKPAVKSIDLKEYGDITYGELAEVLGCSLDPGYSLTDSYKAWSNNSGTRLAEYNRGAIDVRWKSADISAFGCKPGDKWEPTVIGQKLAPSGFTTYHEDGFEGPGGADHVFSAAESSLGFNVENGKIVSMSYYFRSSQPWSYQYN